MYFCVIKTIEMPEIIYLIGPPGCGKSTYTENRIKNFSDKNYVNISSDNIIEEYMKIHNVSYNKAIMSMKQHITYNLLANNMMNAVNDKRNIIVDRTNLTIYGKIFHYEV